MLNQYFIQDYGLRSWPIHSGVWREFYSSYLQAAIVNFCKVWKRWYSSRNLLEVSTAWEIVSEPDLTYKQI